MIAHEADNNMNELAANSSTGFSLTTMTFLYFSETFMSATHSMSSHQMMGEKISNGLPRSDRHMPGLETDRQIRTSMGKAQKEKTNTFYLSRVNCDSLIHRE